MDSPNNILDALNPAQRAAVVAGDGPQLVIAGAGSGKTRVITHRIAYLVRETGVPPWQIFAATFTNKAAQEMKSRIAQLLPGIETARLSIGTFHSICVSILRREAPHAGLDPRFTIADESDQKALVKDCLRTMEYGTSSTRPEEILARIGYAKVRMISPEQARTRFGAEWGEVALQIYEQYETRLAQNNAVDFDDLLLKVVRIFQDKPDVLALYHDRWKYILVDEYQDINGVQFELIKLLAGDRGNLCVVGDEDQSIYSWRGAEIENILSFPDQFKTSEVVRLEQNYRSTETILQAANAVISRNTMRHGKELWSKRGLGEPITTIIGGNEREEAALVIQTILWLRRYFGTPYRDAAIFYRLNALSRLFEDFLREQKIPYRVIGGIRFYDRAEVKDLLAYLRLIVNPLDGISLSRVINKPRRGIGEKTQMKIITAAVQKGVSLWAYLGEAAQNPDLPKKARAGIADLITRVNEWRELSEKAAPHEVLNRVIRDTRYEDSLGAPDSLEALTRKENIEELQRAVEEFSTEHPDQGLQEYLEMVTLASAVDDMNEEDDCVSLMTLHSAKGLEFPNVFITGMEESIFPNSRAVAEARNFEEERRLFYVGVTRAMDRLFISRADARHLYGRTQYNPPSTFLMEIPDELTRSLDAARRSWDESHRESGRSAMLGEAPEAATLADSSPAAVVDLNADEGLFMPGARVRHSKLGEGTVIAARGSGARRKISVRFEAGMEMELLEQYGGLERVEELPF